MINHVAKYQRTLKKHLLCSRTVKKQLLSKFTPALTAFVEENPAPSMDELCAAFGPPKEMAAILMEGFPRNQVTHYRIRRIVFGSILGCFCACFLAYWIAVGFELHRLKTQLVIIDEIGVVDDAPADDGISVEDEIVVIDEVVVND